MRELGREPLFVLGLAIKVVSLFFFGSWFLRELFVPFLDAALLHPGENPWALRDTAHFPYGVVLFAVHYAPKALGYALLGDAALGTGPVALALMKSPLLLFDLWTLRLLLGALPARRSAILALYWLNPVAFYISYVHGQLDVVVTALVLQSLLLLSRSPVPPPPLTLASNTCGARCSGMPVPLSSTITSTYSP